MLSLSKDRIPPHLLKFFKPRRTHKPKDDLMVPHRVYDALMADGWYGRGDIVWAKKNCLPESVRDRPTKSHEYMFLLTKSPRYFFDQEAVREPQDFAHYEKYGQSKRITPKGNPERNDNGGTTQTFQYNAAGRNIRSVWNIATRPYPGQHYSTFPVDLVYPCIKAGTSERGVCEKCGAPWERVVERTGEQKQASWTGAGRGNSCMVGGGHEGRTGRWEATSRTVGWQPTCSCNGEYIKEPYEVSVVNRETGEPETFTRYRSVYVPGIPLSEHPVVPATVLDPFMGSGTTALAARKLGRKSVGFDLDVRNIKQIEERLGWQGVMF